MKRSNRHPLERGAILSPVEEARDRAVERALSILHSEDLAEDVAQDCFLCLLERGEVPRDLTAWAAVGAVPRSLESLRSRRRRSFHEARRAEERAELCAEADPLHDLERREVVEDVRAAIAGLCEEHRAVVERRELLGHDYARIAEDLGIPVGTVRSRLARARRALEQGLRAALSRDREER